MESELQGMEWVELGGEGPGREPDGLGPRQRRAGSPWQRQASDEVVYVGARHEALHSTQQTGDSFNECVLHPLGLCGHDLRPHSNISPTLQRIILKL